MSQRNPGKLSASRLFDQREHKGINTWLASDWPEQDLPFKRKYLVLAEVLYDYETEKKFLLGCIGKNQEWAHKLLACPHDDTKNPIPLPVWAVTVSDNGNYTCLEQKKEIFEESICYQ